MWGLTNLAVVLVALGLLVGFFLHAHMEAVAQAEVATKGTKHYRVNIRQHRSSSIMGFFVSFRCCGSQELPRLSV